MTESEIDRITRAVQEVEPRARLVSRRLLQRVIRRHLDLSPGAKAPHDFGFELPADLVRTLAGDDVGANHLSSILLPLPDDDEGISADAYLLDCWRLLFHAAIDRAVDAASGSFGDDRRLFNATLLHEIRNVLESDHRLIQVDSQSVLYREFAALFLELRYFAPEQLPAFFPGIRDPNEIQHFFESRLNARDLFDQTRPAGAPSPGKVVAHPVAASQSSPAGPKPDAQMDLRARARQAEEKGNDVRAAVCHWQTGDTRTALERLRSLVNRMQRALNLTEAIASEWFESLQPILEYAGRHGFWDVGERMLYELQKACLDVERKAYAVDAVEWMITFGKQPVKRLMQKPRPVNMLRRLRAAAKLLGRIPADELAKEKLDRLLHEAMHALDKRIRDENRADLTHVLDEVGIVPANQAERISRAKMVEELLDTLCSRGFLKMSDLRDALARSRVKLNDLAGPGEFLLGDPIIRANRKLALRMDGIYHRGEFYMRGLQRLSSLGFGTRIGRLLVLWFLLPFAASFVILSGIHEIGHVLGGLAGWLEKTLLGTDVPATEAHGKPILTSPYTIAGFGLFLLGLIHSSRFRRRVGIAARTAFVDVPYAIYHSPRVRRVFVNPATRFFARYLLLPLLVGATIVLLLRSLEYDWQSTLLVGCGSALLTGTFFRTPFGRGIEERLDESLSRLWRVVSVNFLIGVLTLFLQFFRWLFELMERGMYAVDEWSRFREGQSQTMLVFKLIFGLFWFFVTYLFRFAWNLLIEPQINPIKHFPVVTVSHKLILPLAFSTDFVHKPAPLAELLMGPFDLTVKSANTVASTIVWGIPGIFGFLVWELKENWRLYRANRSPVIRAVPVGSHGERVRGLLRPGLHSGVIPKTFAKWRKAIAAGNQKKALKHRHHLEHTAEAMEHVVERDLIACLKASRRWGGLPIHLDRIALATNRLRIFLTIHHFEGALIVSIEERGGWLIGSIEEDAWFPQLSDKQRAAFIDSLAGFYKLCGIHVVREQAAAKLGVESWRIDCRPDGLLVLGKSALETPVAIDYGDDSRMTSDRPIDGKAMTAIEKSELVLTDLPLEWKQWVERWEQDHGGKNPQTGMLAEYRLAAV